MFKDNTVDREDFRQQPKVEAISRKETLINTDVEQLGTVKAIVLHLLPGVLITLFYIVVAPLVMNAGFPAINALLLAAVFILIPFQLGYLFYEGKRKNGRFSLKGVVLYREAIPVWQYFVLLPLLLIWNFVWFRALASLDGFLAQNFFYWLPDWFFGGSLSQYSLPTLLVTFVFLLLTTGIAAPIVEELYFRGYLLPRISRLKGWAPLLNIVLFSLYHFFTPWQFITRIVALLPLGYIVWWKRNIYVGMIQHVLLNTIMTLLLIPVLFG
jgi:membrane protease YdiL (CAAX protease family)